jgi:hypothetical protein
VTRPGRITFRWSRAGDDARLGLGTTGAYWLRDLVARTGGTDAKIDATSSANPEPTETPVRTRTLAVPGDPTPAVVTELAWQPGASPFARTRDPVIALDLTNVGAATLDLAGAGVAPGQAYSVVVSSDGPVTLTLGRATVRVAKGRTTLTEAAGPAAS